MTARKRRRLAFVFALLVSGGAAAGLGIVALQDNVLYFYSPSDVAARRAPASGAFRVGGLVVKGSVTKAGGMLRFTVTDGAASLPVVYRGLPPSLFAEGQGVVAAGRLQGGGFVADQLLARHDETYTPPEVTDALRRAGHLDARR